jgi:hypothetical protein
MGVVPRYGELLIDGGGAPGMKNAMPGLLIVRYKLL